MHEITKGCNINVKCPILDNGDLRGYLMVNMFTACVSVDESTKLKLVVHWYGGKPEILI